MSGREAPRLVLVLQNTTFFVTLGTTVVRVKPPNSGGTSQVRVPVPSAVIQTVFGFSLALGDARARFLLFFNNSPTSSQRPSAKRQGRVHEGLC